MQWQTLKRPVLGLALAAAAAALTPAHAGMLTLDVTGILSNDELGAATNETRSVDLGFGVHITGISWDVRLFADAPSWLSEISVDLSDETGAGFSLSPGFGDNVSGTGSYAGSADLVSMGVDFFLGGTGRLNFEFFETFSDYPGAWDGIWSRGALTVSYVPEPASFGLAALALLGVGAASRRRGTRIA